MMSPTSVLDLIADLSPSPVSWSVLLLVATVVIALTLTGVTARVVNWFGSIDL